ncbi:MAG TPA: ABC transporter ATP-binding protein [Geminicoccaceae bacterium]|nr:ABC transporter ATP-binding protein [Geminicoccaceae bacterium]
MRNILRLFFNAEGINPWTVLLCLIAASVIEGIGFVSLVPLLLVATDTGTGDASPWLVTARDLAGSVGLHLTAGNLIIFFVTTVIVNSVLTFFAMQHVGTAVATFSAGLRLQLIRNLFRARWSYLVQHPVGSIANAISQAGQSGNAYQLAASFFAQTVQTTVYLLVAFFVSWQLALAAMAIGVVMAAALHFLVQMARKAGWRQTQRTRELVTLLVDSLNNIKPLRAMAKEAEFARFLERKIDSVRKAIRREVISQQALRNGNELLAAICLGTGFFVAIAIWRVPIVELVVVGVLLKRTSNGIAKIQQMFQQAVAVESPYLEVSALIADAERAPESAPGHRPAILEQGCRLEEVSFWHGDVQILKSVSIDIPAGCVTVLMGPSGAGKTTIADIILGLHAPDRGRVLIDGVPLAEIDLKSWRRLIGYVPQDLVLFHDTIHANVALGDPQIGEAEVRRALQLAGAWEFIAALPDGLRTHVGQSGAKLSGGERQRIALARALVCRPKLLVLDEVTSALDPGTERQICANVRSLAGEVTVLAITHRPALLDIADRCYRVEAGRVEETSAVAPLALAQPG